jgi:predicted ABC-type sugar transport system permease subunit
LTPFSEPEQNWLLRAARHHFASVVVAGRFLPIWLATGVLLLVAAIIAPRALQNTSWAYVLPYMSVLAVAALGQMLVIMQAGIDLSTPGVMSFAGNLIVGVSLGQDGRLWLGLLACLGLGAGVGLVNGILVGIVRLNPLIVTLAVGQIVAAWARTRRQPGWPDCGSARTASSPTPPPGRCTRWRRSCSPGSASTSTRPSAPATCSLRSPLS